MIDEIEFDSDSNFDFKIVLKSFLSHWEGIDRTSTQFTMLAKSSFEK